MIALLDTSVLIALFDAAHVHHADAHEWFGRNRGQGWATCPLTQNASIRILSQPVYPGRLSVSDAARRLGNAIAAADHHFWNDSVSFCDAARFAHGRILTPRHLTDVYLLALATEKQARLVTFDRSIPVAAVPGARERNLLVL